VHLFRSVAAGALRRRKKENGERGKLSSKNDGVSNVKLGKIGRIGKIDWATNIIATKTRRHEFLATD